MLRRHPYLVVEQRIETFTSEQVLEALPGDVQVLDVGGRLVLHKPAAEGVASGSTDLIGRSIEDWCRARGLPETLATQRRATFDRCLATGRSLVDRERWPGTLGGVRHAIRAMAPLYDEAGGRLGVVVLAVELPQSAAGDRIVPDANSQESPALREALTQVRRRLARFAEDNQKLRSSGATTGEPGASVYADLPGMASTRSQIEQVSLANGPVLVTGEPGTGTRAVARIVLANDGGAAAAWREIDCVDEPDRVSKHLARLGELCEATGGPDSPPVERWLFHEIGGLSRESCQVLLEIASYFQSKTSTSTAPHSDAPDANSPHGPRIVVTTNRDLSLGAFGGGLSSSLEGAFRSRTVRVPALRHRSEDVELLAARLLDRTAVRQGRVVEPFNGADIARLRGYLWPGNIDELRTVVERAVLAARDRRPQLTLPDPAGEVAPLSLGVPAQTRAGVLTEAEVRRLEKDNLVAALSHTGWKVYGEDGAAALLGLRPTTLASRIKKLNIARPGERT